ncbi:MAG: thioesterase [Mesorhizobium amorphae]|nr:MAG: thioesterase [Mesorhizobium amorphae]
MPNASPAPLEASAVQALIEREYPQLNAGGTAYRVTAVTKDGCVLALAAGEPHLRPGGTVSGPTLFTLADVGGFACALAHGGGDVLAVTTNVSINFMRKARPGPIEARCRILKLGRTLMVFEANIVGVGSDEPIAHAVGTYALRVSDARA